MEANSDDQREKGNLTSSDKYFTEQRDLIVQDINNTMDSILNSLNSLNISLENSVAVGKEFECVADLWKTFYNGLESGNDATMSSQDNDPVHGAPEGSKK